MLGVAAGSCATAAREPGQGRKAAALSGSASCAAVNLAATPSIGQLPVPHPTIRLPSMVDSAESEASEPASGAEQNSYQSLYRRFRPQRFDEVLGQEHVSLALRNSVRDGRAGHAYLFSGQRGTGKTSTARILAKALNCAKPVDGEPCGVCNSCVEIARGTSMDVHELDAASNNGVEAMRDLVARSALGTPGRWKVYIIDEVHMLSAAASNALLKTLEEPPRHVVFVLATTDPQKVLPTIRSRTQHFEFRLLGPETLSGLLSRVRAEAALVVGDDAVDSAVRRGRGSARDALSALDQIAAGGAVRDEVVALAEMADALAERDAPAVLVHVAKAFSAGLDAQRLAAELADYLRQGFLTVLAPELAAVTGDERVRVEQTARTMGLPSLVRAMEALGRALVDMRDSPDTRVHLEAVLIRLAHPEMDDSPAALLERIERLERASSAGAGSGPVATGAAGSRHSSTRVDPASGSVPGATEGASGSGPQLARRALGGAVSSEAGQVQSPGEPPSAGSSSAGPTRDDLVQVWGDELLAKLPARARVRFRVGRFLSSPAGSAVFALPSETHRAYCEEVRADVEAALAARFGTRVPLELVVDEEAPAEQVRAPGAGRAATGQEVGARRPSRTSRAQEPGPPMVGGERATRGQLPPERAEHGQSPAAAVEGAQAQVEHEADFLDPEVLAAETKPAGAGPSPEERIKLAFPGAVEV
jgi:DNA polymerase-3 subunit gamma/tau